MTRMRAIAFWLIGTICVFFGSLIAGSVEIGSVGATSLSVTFAYIIAFVMILMGGMFWITTGILQEEEKPSQQALIPQLQVLMQKHRSD